MKKILIYDDEPFFEGKVRRLLEKLPAVTNTFEIKTPREGELEDLMTILKDRRRAFRRTGTWEDGKWMSVDDASIFAVDYDLLEATGLSNGDFVAYLARCFSKCGLIVGYRYRDNAFDLTLRGEPRSFTDLYVGGDQLDNLGLWRATEVTELNFRPWYWPILPNYLSDFKKKVEDVEESLAEDVPICQVLGFAPELFAMLPRSIGQFLGAEPAKTTFRRFVEESGSGLERRDAEDVDDVSDEVLARVGAARISKWLERLVLPEQDIIVDAPHLVSRYPSLMTGDRTNIKTWNRTARLTRHEELGLDTDLIESYRLKKDYWLSRPVWFWDDLRGCEKITEVREPWKFERPHWVFCEDMSRFHTREDCREFVADVESPYARRFVRHFDDVEYRHVVRFSL